MTKSNVTVTVTLSALETLEADATVTKAMDALTLSATAALGAVGSLTGNALTLGNAIAAMTGFAVDKSAKLIEAALNRVLTGSDATDESVKVVRSNMLTAIKAGIAGWTLTQHESTIADIRKTATDSHPAAKSHKQNVGKQVLSKVAEGAISTGGKSKGNLKADAKSGIVQSIVSPKKRTKKGKASAAAAIVKRTPQAAFDAFAEQDAIAKGKHAWGIVEWSEFAELVRDHAEAMEIDTAEADAAAAA